MLLTEAQRAVFDDTSVTKSVTLNFYRGIPTFLYPSGSLYPINSIYPGVKNDIELVVSISGDKVKSESIKVTESICNNKTIIFGSVIANKMTATIETDVDVKGLYVEYTMTANEIILPIFYGIVDDSTRSTVTNREMRNIVAYDILYSYLDMDITNWFSTQLTFPMSIYDLRMALATNFGLEYQPTTLVNDNLIIQTKYDLSNETLTARNLLKYICELNGVFASVNRYQQVRFVSLTPFSLIYPDSALFPSNTLFPGIVSESSEVATISAYKPSDYGEYTTREINKVEVYDKSNAMISSFGLGSNVYKISSNILASSMESAVLLSAITNFYDLVSQIVYVPISVSIQAMPYLEVGDVVQFLVGVTSISSFIFQRTLSGTTADKLEAKGDEYHNLNYWATAITYAQMEAYTWQQLGSLTYNELEGN